MTVPPDALALPATAALIAGLALLALRRGAASAAALQSFAVCLALLVRGWPVQLFPPALVFALAVAVLLTLRRPEPRAAGRISLGCGVLLALVAVAAARPDLPLGLALAVAALGLTMAVTRRDQAGQGLGLLGLGNGVILAAATTGPPDLPLIVAGAMLPAVVLLLPDASPLPL